MQMFEGIYDAPTYSDRYDFPDGAQPNLFQDATVGGTPAVVSSSSHSTSAAAAAASSSPAAAAAAPASASPSYVPYAIFYLLRIVADRTFFQCCGCRRISRHHQHSGVVECSLRKGLHLVCFRIDREMVRLPPFHFIYYRFPHTCPPFLQQSPRTAQEEALCGRTPPQEARRPRRLALSLADEQEEKVTHRHRGPHKFDVPYIPPLSLSLFRSTSTPGENDHLQAAFSSSDALACFFSRGSTWLFFIRQQSADVCGNCCCG